MNPESNRLVLVHVASPALPAVIERADPVTQRRLLGALVARVFERASPAERSRLLEALIRPTGLLSLAAVAGGLFATWRLRSRGGEVRVPVEEASRVAPPDLAALVEHLVQVGTDTLDGLAAVLVRSPLLGSSAAAVLLLVLLLRQAGHRPRLPPGADFEP